MRSVLDYLEKSCISFKDKKAFEDENRSLTFYQTRHYAKVISNEIINRIGFTSNQPVLIFLPKGVNAVISMLGTVYSGNFYTPIDTNFPEKRILDIKNELEPSVVITDTKNKEKILNSGITEEKIICYDTLDFKQKIENLKENTKNAIDTDLVYTYYTSGSTGKPKGVMISHRNIIDYINFACKKFPIDESTIFGNQSSLYFDISTQDIYATLKKGASMVIIPEKLFAFPIKAVEFIRDKNINFLYWVPSAYINLANFKALDSIVLNKIKAIMFGGEIMPVKHLNYLVDRLPGLNFVANVYGPTEATVNSTYCIINKKYKEEEVLPLGHAIDNKRILLLDNNNQPVQKKGDIGEICVIGASVSPGYYKNPQKTEEVFVQNPLNKSFSEKMYKTGDLAMYDNEGLLMFCGRKDNQIKHLGYRIELGDIETATLSMDAISNCITFYNDEKRQITLIYVSDSSDERQLKLQLTKILPKYMVPTKYHRINALPLNTNGKIDRVLLKAKYS